MRLKSALPLTSLVFLATSVQADEDPNYDPVLNYRPENVTGLDYYYYPWRGSYYNGTAVFTITHIIPNPYTNRDNEDLCPQLQNHTASFSYPALLAITQTEGEDEQPQNTNPINILLSTSYSNFTAYFSDYMDSGGNMQVGDEPWVFESIGVSRRTYTNSQVKPDFNLTVSEGSGNGSPFRISGTSDLDANPLRGIEMNMTSCTSLETAWGVSFIAEDDDDEGEIGVTNPSLVLTFDDHSANFALQSWVFANVFDEDDDTLQIAARMSVEFLGRHDDARSDILNSGTPVSWTPTVGFGNNSANLDSESGAGTLGRTFGGFWGVGLAVVYALL
ncbi:hypothetical protein BJX99DRAFT_265064 [Aspergillus californicus]